MILLLLFIGLSVTNTDTDLDWQLLNLAVDEAHVSDKPILVYVHASWCGACLKMEKEVFPNVDPLLNRFSLAQLDYDDHDSSVDAFGKKQSPFDWALELGTQPTPTFVFLTADGQIITRVSGFIEQRGFSLLLAYVATKAYKHSSFEDYADSID